MSSRAHLSLGDDIAETALDSVDAFFEKKLLYVEKSSVWRISTGCHVSEPFHTQVAATRGINVVLLDVNEKVITGSRSAPIVTPMEMRKYKRVQRLELS